MPLCYVGVNPPIEVTMIEAFLFEEELRLLPVLDAIDIYEGSIPPSATFQVVDVDNTTEGLVVDPTGDGNAN